MRYFQTAIGHAAAAATVIVATVALSVVSYFGLLAWALAVGEPIGGALALPFMLLLALVASCAAVLTVLFPSTLVSHVVCRLLDWPRWLEIPLSTLAAIIVSVAIGVVVGWRQSDIEHGLQLALISVVVLLVALGLYWWSLQGTTFLMCVVGKGWDWMARREQRR